MFMITTTLTANSGRDLSRINVVTQANSRFKDVRRIHISSFNLQLIDYDPFIPAGNPNSRPDNSPTVPGDTHTFSGQASLHHANLLAIDIVSKIVCGCPQGEGNGKKSQARTKFTISRAGSDQNNLPS